jgi:hypothetical protein
MIIGPDHLLLPRAPPAGVLGAGQEQRQRWRATTGPVTPVEWTMVLWRDGARAGVLG